MQIKQSARKCVISDLRCIFVDELNGALRAIVIGVRGTDETCMGLARLIHDLHPRASAPSIQTIPDLKIGARSLSGMIYV